MREAVGGLTLFQVVLIFLVVYIMFMALVLHYGYTFRIKNTLINYIEQHEGLSSEQEIKDKAIKLGYNLETINSGKWLDVCYYDLGNNRYYYQLSVYMTQGLPLVRKNINLKITGETRIINTDTIVPPDTDISPCES